MKRRWIFGSITVVLFALCQCTPQSHHTNPSTKVAQGSEASFFRMKVDAETVVFILDNSGVMLDTFDYLRESVISTVKSFPSQRKFNVIMLSGLEAVPVYPETQLATDSLKKDFAEKMAKIRAMGSGDSLGVRFSEAFEKAFKMKPDAIYFVQSSYGFDPRVPNWVAKLNEGKTVKIHTLPWVYHDASFENQMKDIAESNGGSYRFVEVKDVAVWPKETP